MNFSCLPSYVVTDEEFEMAKQNGKCYISMDPGYDGGTYEVKFCWYNGKMYIESVKERLHGNHGL